MKLLLVFVCLFGMAACGKQPAANNQTMNSAEIDSMLVALEDSLSEEIEKGELVPETADEDFTDFVYNFAESASFQLARIVFPLPYYSDLKKDTFLMEEWKHDSLFSAMDTYTMLYDDFDDMERAKERQSTSVKVEWIYLKERKLKRYYFERLGGVWKLEAIDYADIPYADDAQEDFLDFYGHFAADSVFQSERLAHPTKFVTSDPDNDFQILETSLESGQWFAFKPALPQVFLTNINFGQRWLDNSNRMVVELKGLGNGFSNILYFERHGGIWKLHTFEDLSN